MPPPGFGPPGLDPMLGKLVCFTVGIGGVGWTQVPSGGSEFWLICIQLWYLVVSVCNFCCVDHW